MSLHRLGHLADEEEAARAIRETVADHCDACGEPDDGTQTYCECGEPLIEEKYMPPGVSPPPADDSLVRELFEVIKLMSDQIGRLTNEVVRHQRRLDVLDDQVDQLSRR